MEFGVKRPEPQFPHLPDGSSKLPHPLNHEPLKLPEAQ